MISVGLALLAVCSSAKVPEFLRRGLRRHARDAGAQHFVFSTSCNAFQYWQSELLLFSAALIGQKGKFTHIVVGCDRSEGEGMHGKRRYMTHEEGGDEVVDAAQWQQSTHPRVKRFFAPSIPQAKEFPWFNKPWSFHYWANHTSTDIAGDVIIILDPDQFFVAQLMPTPKGPPRKSHMEEEIYKKIVTETEHAPSSEISDWWARVPNDSPRKGRGVGAYYGIGGTPQAVSPHLAEICGADSPCAKMTFRQYDQLHSVGPPYMLVAEDFLALAPLWWQYMLGAYQYMQGNILADMYAYQMAAANIGIRHLSLDDLMVSAALDTRQGWATVDAAATAESEGGGGGEAPLSCHNPTLPAAARRAVAGVEEGGNAYFEAVEPLTFPFVHMAEHYKACEDGELPEDFWGDAKCSAGAKSETKRKSTLWNFHKGHLPPSFFECGTPLLVPPPDNLIAVQTTDRGRHGAYMVCAITSMLNRAAIDFKSKFCADKAKVNKAKCLRITSEHQRERSFGKRNNPRNWPFAVLADECTKSTRKKASGTWGQIGF